MPYFFILPAFVLYLLALAGGIVLATLYKPVAWLRPYLTAVLTWSSVGFVAATVVYVAIFLVSILALKRFVDGPSVIGGVLMGIVGFVLPFVASGLGVLAGAAFGIRRVWRRSTNVALSL